MCGVTLDKSLTFSNLILLKNVGRKREVRFASGIVKVGLDSASGRVQPRASAGAATGSFATRASGRHILLLPCVALLGIEEGPAELSADMFCPGDFCSSGEGICFQKDGIWGLSEFSRSRKLAFKSKHESPWKAPLCYFLVPVTLNPRTLSAPRPCSEPSRGASASSLAERMVLAVAMAAAGCGSYGDGRQRQEDSRGFSYLVAPNLPPP